MNRNAFRVPSDIPQSRMPEYQRQQLTASPGADVSARLSSDAGAIIRQGADNEARQLDMLGKGMQQAAKAGYDLYTDYQTSKAKDAWLQYKQQAAGLKAELATLAGKDAIDPEKGVQARITKDMSEARTRITKDLGGMAAGLFERAASEVDSDLSNWGIGKAHGEAVNYGNATSKARISLAQNEALSVASDAKAFGEKMGIVETELKSMAERSGFDETWVQAGMQDVQQKTLVQAISDSIAGEQLGRANSMIKAYTPMLGGAAEGLRARISAKGRELSARSEALSEKNKNRAAITEAQSIIQEFGGDSQKALEHINAKSESVEDRLRLTSAYLTHRRIDDAAQAQIRQEQELTSQNSILASIKAAGNDPASLSAIVADAAPQHKSFATAHAEQALGKQPPAFTDPEAWADASASVLNGERYELVMARNIGRISKTDMKALESLAAKEDKQNEQEWKLYFDRIWSASSHARIADTADRNQNKNQLEYEAARRLRTVTDPGKARDIIFDLVHDRTVKGMFWNSKVTSLGAKEHDAKKLEYTVPEDIQDRIEKDLKKNGLKNPTKEKIYEIFVKYRAHYGY